jgi:hypothetical protein
LEVARDVRAYELMGEDYSGSRGLVVNISSYKGNGSVTTQPSTSFNAKQDFGLVDVPYYCY